MRDLEGRAPGARAGTRRSVRGRDARYACAMSTPNQDDPQLRSRAELVPEEQVVGSDDPQAQAEAILADSEERVRHQADDVCGASAQTRPRTSDEAT